LLGLRGDETAYWASVSASTAALKKNGQTLKVSTDAGLQNRTALDGQAAAAGAYLAKMQEQGVPQQEFQKQLGISRKNLYDTALAFSGSKQWAKWYTDQILGIPKVAPTKATLDKAGAQAAARAYSGALSGIFFEVPAPATLPLVATGLSLSHGGGASGRQRLKRSRHFAGWATARTSGRGSSLTLRRWCLPRRGSTM
jgi:hypothetical protein